jgi:hypothetical protein
MPSVIRENHVAYFWLPARVTGMSVREVGKLVLYCLLTAAADYHEAGNRRKQIHLVIDEFQEIVAENIRLVLQQARSFGVGVILASQDPDALDKRNVRLRRVVMTNTRMKQLFTVTDAGEIDELMKLSGETTADLTTETFGEQSSTSYGYHVTSTDGTSHALAYRQTRVPRLQANEIIDMTDKDPDSILMVSRGSRYTQLGGIPTRIWTPWPLTLDEYNRRLETPWPSKAEAPHAIVPAKTPQEAVDHQRAFLQEELGEILSELQADEHIDGTDDAQPPSAGKGKKPRGPKKT